VTAGTIPMVPGRAYDERNRIATSPELHAMTALSAFGPFRVHERLGGGGTGVVMRCTHTAGGASVALKVPQGDGRPAREALRREIGILRRTTRSQLRGVVPLLDHGIERDVPWYAMELLDGHSLRYWVHRLWFARSTERPDNPIAEVTQTQTIDPGARLRELHAPESDAGRVARSSSASGLIVRRRYPAAAGQLERVLEVALRLAEILSRLHAEGIVHGDLTPANVLFRDETDPVLIDFGAALAATEADVWREVPWADAGERGTPGYIAPELILRDPIDARADLYSLGCILYELVSGVRAYEGARVRDILQQQASRDPEPLAQHVDDLPAELDALVLSLMARDPTRRISRAEDACVVLRQLIGGPRKSSEIQPTLGLFRPRLHGRSQPLHDLFAAYDRALTGTVQFILVGGASGIGKTRLMNELGRHAARCGSVVVWCRARLTADVEADSTSRAHLALFAPLLELLSELRWTSQRNTEAEDMRQAYADLGSLAAAFVDDVSELGSGATPQEVERRAFDGLAFLMRQLAASTGLVVLIDDLQWSDELCRRFLNDIQRLANSRILIVANYRVEDASRALAGIEHVATSSLNLEALRFEDSREMIQDLLATTVLPDGFARFVAKHAEGNPFFVAEYTRAAIARGVVSRAGGGWRFRAGSNDEFALPDSIDGLLGLRVQQLSETARNTLRLICVLDRDFATSTFGALTGIAAESSETLEELVARDVLVVSSPGHYRFAHDKLREAQEQALDQEERKRQHAHVAMHLEQSLESVSTEQHAALGHHWAFAGIPARALEHLVPAAAATARAGHTLDRATRLYRLAIQQCDLIGTEAHRDMRRSLREQLADVLVMQAKHSEARECLRSLLDELEPAQMLDRARAWRKAATSHWTLHDYAAAEFALDRAHEALVQLGPGPTGPALTELIQIRLGRFEQLYFAGKTGPDLDRVVHELRPLIEAHGTPEQACVYYFMAASYSMLLRRYAFDPEAVQLAQRGIDAAAGLSPQQVAFAHFILAYALALGSQDSCRESLVHFDRALHHAQRIGDATLLSRIRTYHATAYLRLGDIAQTQICAQGALDAAIEAQLPPYIAAANFCQGWVAWKSGRVEQGLSMLQGARDRWKAHPHKFPLQSLALFPLLDSAQQQDDFETATVLLVELREGLPSFPSDLVAAIETAREAIDRSCDQYAATAIANVLERASAHGFV